MKKALLCFLALLPMIASAYQLQYAEEFYELFHRHLYEDPTKTMENIYWLEKALSSDFANPLNALARIENRTEWEKYRYLFYSHVNLKLVEQHIQLARNYDKREAYFFNYPWRGANLKSLEIAEEIYTFTKYYWEEAKSWAEKASAFPYIELEEIRFWADEAYRINSGELDYEFILDRHLRRLQEVRADFEAMDESTY